MTRLKCVAHNKKIQILNSERKMLFFLIFHLFVFSCISLYLLVLARLCLHLLVLVCICSYLLVFACICFHLLIYVRICLEFACISLYILVNAGIGMWRPMVSRGPWTRARQEIHLASSKINFFPFKTKSSHKGSFHYICSVRQIDMTASGRMAASRHIVLSHGEYNGSFLGELTSF